MTKEAIVSSREGCNFASIGNCMRRERFQGEGFPTIGKIAFAPMRF